MRIQLPRPLKLFVFVLMVGFAVVSGMQLRADANILLLCTNTGQACHNDMDCTRTNPTCFCANINATTKVGVCREDF